MILTWYLWLPILRGPLTGLAIGLLRDMLRWVALIAILIRRVALLGRGV